MSPQIIIAALIAAAGFGGAWQLQEWRYAAKEKDRVEQQLENERLASAATIRRTEAVVKAQSASAARTTALRRDADGARSALVGLRDATEQALRDAATSLDACTVASSKLKVVLMECSGKYEEVARDADLWENSAITLRDAWPK